MDEKKKREKKSGESGRFRKTVCITLSYLSFFSTLGLKRPAFCFFPIHRFSDFSIFYLSLCIIAWLKHKMDIALITDVRSR